MGSTHAPVSRTIFRTPARTERSTARRRRRFRREGQVVTAEARATVHMLGIVCVAALAVWLMLALLVARWLMPVV
jgi:flagellar biosynthesis protein FlhB